nr:unnamed protein product [Digitaria exilis]
MQDQQEQDPQLSEANRSLLPSSSAPSAVNSRLSPSNLGVRLEFPRCEAIRSKARSSCAIQRNLPLLVAAAAMENQKRLSFTIPSNPRRLTFRARPAAAAVDEETSPPSTPSPHFITEFDPSETLTPTAAAAAPVAITPIPNSHLFQRFIPSDPCERPSLPTTTTEEGIDFTAAESGDANPTSIASSSSFAYGLNKSKKAPPQATSSAELMRLRFKQDIAALPDHGDAEEDSMLSGKDFAAAFLKAYGWRKDQTDDVGLQP